MPSNIKAVFYYDSGDNDLLSTPKDLYMLALNDFIFENGKSIDQPYSANVPDMRPFFTNRNNHVSSHAVVGVTIAISCLLCKISNRLLQVLSPNGTIQKIRRKQV